MPEPDHCWHRFLGIRMLLPWPGWGGCRCCWCGAQALLHQPPGPEACVSRHGETHGPYRWAWAGRPRWLQVVLGLTGDSS
jgi:hypothetical protein